MEKVLEIVCSWGETRNEISRRKLEHHAACSILFIGAHMDYSSAIAPTVSGSLPCPYCPPTPLLTMYVWVYVPNELVCPHD